jgi:hypothetical protein
MSGGSNDDAVLAITHQDGARVVLDLIVSQSGAPPVTRSIRTTFSVHTTCIYCRL